MITLLQGSGKMLNNVRIFYLATGHQRPLPINYCLGVASSCLFNACNMNAFFALDLSMVYIPECKQQLRTMKQHMPIQDIAL
jgi:hypothetical protein